MPAPCYSTDQVMDLQVSMVISTEIACPAVCEGKHPCQKLQIVQWEKSLLGLGCRGCAHKKYWQSALSNYTASFKNTDTQCMILLNIWNINFLSSCPCSLTPTWLLPSVEGEKIPPEPPFLWLNPLPKAHLPREERDSIPVLGNFWLYNPCRRFWVHVHCPHELQHKSLSL